jgi:hypothetical protein
VTPKPTSPSFSVHSKSIRNTQQVVSCQNLTSSRSNHQACFYCTTLKLSQRYVAWKHPSLVALYIGRENQSMRCFQRGPTSVFELQQNSKPTVSCTLAIGRSPLDGRSLRTPGNPRFKIFIKTVITLENNIPLNMNCHQHSPTINSSRPKFV